MDAKQLLKQRNFTYTHSLGQNFIFDTNLLSAIAQDSGDGKGYTCVEIGAGVGTLTNMLAQHYDKVIAYEIDKKVFPLLTENVQGDNVVLINADIMKTDIEQIEGQIEGRYRVVANLPYYITTPIITMFVEQSTRCDSLTVTVQEEVADRLVSKPNTKDYGAITVGVWAVANAKITRRISRTAFTPSPNVDSAVLRIDFAPDKFDIMDKKLLRRVVKCGFAMRRKTLVNNLQASFGLDKDKCCQLLEQLQISPDVRGESLSVSQYVALANLLHGVI